MKQRRYGSVLFAIVGCLVAGGCCMSHRCRQTSTTGATTLVAAAAAEASGRSIEGYKVRPEQFQQMLEARAATPGRAKPVQVLVLSGGGSNGAWGAGVLKGWAATGRRPEFDVVTGISAGALLSTGAFLGDDDLLHDAFTRTSDRDVQRNRLLITVPFSDSLRTTGPLRSLIKRFLSDATLDRVAAEGRKQRSLFVGTVNLDTGHFTIIDLTKLAMDHRYDDYRAAVLASASAPVLYPPTEIGGHLYVDGGVRAMLFFRSYLVPGVRATTRRAAAAAAAGAASARPSNVYVIVNGKPGASGKCTEDCLIPIAVRSLSLLTDANTLTNIAEIKLMADEMKFGFFLSYIPDDVEPVDSFTFDPAKMTELYDHGVHFGQTGTSGSWMPPPDVEDRL